ncbi:MAG TPA: hypothetical protein VF618_25690 [Thermoanaerobaculia bacterium]
MKRLIAMLLLFVALTADAAGFKVIVNAANPADELTQCPPTAARSATCRKWRKRRRT